MKPLSRGSIPPSLSLLLHPAAACLGCTTLILRAQHHRSSYGWEHRALAHSFLDVKNSKQGIFPNQTPRNSCLTTSPCSHWPKHMSPGPPTCSFRRGTGQPWPYGPARAYALPGGQYHPFQGQTSGAKQGKAHLRT